MTETGTTQTICKLCPAEAEVLKFEAEYGEDEEGYEQIAKVEIAICRACAHDWYDGTEEFPGTHPLPMVLAA